MQFQTAWMEMMALKAPHQILHKIHRYAKRFTVRRRLPYLLFDAGGTIVFPDVNLIIKKLARHDFHLRPDQLYEGYYHVISKLNNQAGPLPGERKHWPKGYVYELFDELGVIDPNTSLLAAEIQKQHKKKNLWTFTYPWVSETLTTLRDLGYKMSVLSNSDRRAKQVLREVGLLHYFEDVFDSGELGVAKPDPRIFNLALEALHLKPSEVLYIGDLYDVDVKGANSAGIGAVHIDPLGKFAGQPGVHIQDIRALPAWLEANYNNSIAEGSLFPFRTAENSRQASPSGEAPIRPSMPR